MGTTNSQDDAFNFCKGKPIKKSTGGGYTVQKKDSLRLVRGN